MTQKTETERDEFKQWLAENPQPYVMQVWAQDEIMFKVWRDARRAPVVPNELREAAKAVVNAISASANGVTFEHAQARSAILGLSKALEAAPQSPEESNSVDSHQIKQAAPVEPVPQGWIRGIQITEEMHAAACKVLFRAYGLDGTPQRMLDAMLAAAPQPPEVEHSEQRLDVVVAPVQLPEPSAWMLGCQTMGGDVDWKLSWSKSGAGVCHRLNGKEFEQPLYTEQQVRALLSSKSKGN